MLKMKPTAAQRRLEKLQPKPVKEAVVAEKTVLTKTPRAPKVKAEKPVSAPLAPVPIVEWKNCYDDGWNGLIVDEAFSHPAKAGRGLIRKIYDHLFDIGAIHTGSTVVDPFGGIGTTGIEGAWRGCKVVCVELEPRFVALGQENFELHRRGWEAMNRPQPIIIQGDSRQLRRVVQEAGAIVSSPPFGEQQHGGGIAIHGTPTQRKYGMRAPVGYQQQGESDGQLADMKHGDIDATLSSPPYNLPMSQDHNGTRGGTRGTTPSEDGAFVKYGNTPGQLDGLPMGDVDALVSSPPYNDIAAGAGGLNTKPAAAGQQGGRSPDSASQQADQHYGDSDGQLSLLQKGEVADVVVSSPPYADLGNGVKSGKVDESKWTTGTVGRKMGSSHQEDGYSIDPNNLGNMPAGSADSVISSPPYADLGVNIKGHGIIGAGVSNDKHYGEAEYGTTAGQLDDMKAESVDSIVSSPPYAETSLSGGGGIAHEMRNTYREGQNYGDAAGQVGAMKDAGGVDAVISSPPYATDQLGDGHRGGRKQDDKVLGAMMDGYGTSAGQVSAMEPGSVDSVISSPPYADSVNQGDAANDNAARQARIEAAGLSSKWQPDFPAQAYGKSAGQLGALRDSGVEAVLSSPPYASSLQANTDGADASKAPRVDGANWGSNADRSRSATGYSADPGNLGNMPEAAGVAAVTDAAPTTFWAASLAIVRECHAILKPGGTAVWILKSFIRDGKIVNFPEDWRKLCEFCGFETITEVHAMLVEDDTSVNLFGEEETTRISRKSFFRRLCESKGAPEINFEVVYIMKRK